MAPATVGFVLSLALGHTTARQAPGSVLTQSQLQTYQNDGAILIRGLLQGELLDAAVAKGAEIAQGARKTVHYDRITFQDLHKHEVFRRIALHPDIAAIVRELTDAECDDVRVLKDAFLSSVPGKPGCGWHRDDSYFWPCPADAPGPGCNVWIALSPMKVEHGGGLAVARGSYRAPWLPEAIKAIEGQTCALETVAPHLHEKCEAVRQEWDVQPGDAIVHTRFCFHRGVPWTERGTAEWDGEPLMRYSVRYMPGEAVLDPQSFDPAVKEDGLGGKSLRSLGWRYPVCWPEASAEEEEQIRALAAGEGKASASSY